MKINNKGFATSGILYTILLLIIILLVGILTLLASRKIVLNDYKLNIIKKLENNDYSEKTYDENSYNKAKMLIFYDSITNKRLIDNNEISNGIFKDLSGKNNDGVLNGFNYTSDSGWGDNYLKLDSTDDNIMTNLYAATTFPSNTVFTIEMFLKMNSVTAVGNTGGQSDTGVLIGAFYYNGYGIGWQTNNSNSLEYRLFVGNRTINSSQIITSDIISDFNQTLHLVYKFDGINNKQEFYINGNKMSEKLTAIGDYNQEVTMGNIGINKNQIFGGNYRASRANFDLYNLKIYERLLSENEIVKNYNIDKIRYLK